MDARKLIPGSILAVLVVAASVSSLDAQVAAGRIAFIDSQAVLAEAPGAQEAQAEFDRQMENFTREIEGLEQELDSLIRQYQQQQATLVQSVREARELEIRQKDQRYQQRLEEMEYEAAMTRQRLVQPILNHMIETIEAIRTEGGYAIIFDAAAQSIIAADPSLDLTDQVLERMRRTAGQP